MPLGRTRREHRISMENQCLGGVLKYGKLSQGRTHEVWIYDFGVSEETRSPLVVELCERAAKLIRIIRRRPAGRKSRHTWANTEIISCCMSVNLLYSSYGQWPRTLPSHLAHPAISFKPRSWIATSNKLPRNELTHNGGPALLSSFAEGVFVIQADIRKVYIWDSDVRELEQPSRTAFRADLAGSIIAMKDAAQPNLDSAEIIGQRYRNDTHRS